MTPEFCHAVRMLRALPEPYRVMVLHAALNWSDERLYAEEMQNYLCEPGGPVDLAKPNVVPMLKLVPSGPMTPTSNA